MRQRQSVNVGLVILSFFIGAVVAVFAGQQPMGGQGMGQGRGRRDMVQMRLQRMSRILNLTDQQRAKIRPLLENESGQMRALFGNNSLSQEDRRSKSRELRQKTMREIRPILTKDQRPKLEEAMAPPRRSRRGGPTMGPPPSGQPPSQQ